VELGVAAQHEARIARARAAASVVEVRTDPHGRVAVASAGRRQSPGRIVAGVRGQIDGSEIEVGDRERATGIARMRGRAKGKNRRRNHGCRQSRARGRARSHWQVTGPTTTWLSFAGANGNEARHSPAGRVAITVLLSPRPLT